MEGLHVVLVRAVCRYKKQRRQCAGKGLGEHTKNMMLRTLVFYYGYVVIENHRISVYGMRILQFKYN